MNYAASKSGLVGFARSLTRELGGRGITANVVAPGLHRDRHDRRASRGDAGGVQAQHPRRPLRDPDEVAGVVTWIASDDAAYISGAVIPVDGGLGMGH